MSATMPPNVTPQRIMQMTWGFAAPLMLEAAIRHGVFDTLNERAKTLEEIAHDTGASRRGLRALLDALVGIQLLARQGQNYALTDESSTFLVSTKPSFQGGMFRHITTQLLPSWLKLTEIVKTGKPAAAVNQEKTGGEFFAEFVEALFPMSAPTAAMMAEHVLGKATGPVTVLDIAAGSGVWGILCAKASPNVRITAVDWPEVIPVTRRVAQKNGVVDRFTFVEGDLDSADFGTGHALATLGHILHSEGEARSRMLLKKVFAALAPGGTIAISEFIVDDDRRGPVTPLIFGINMLVNTDVGDVFTLAEMTRWLLEAGFTNIRQLQTPSPSPLILADKPK